MKKNDILLDFTSLLDIVLIILFFFVLYSNFEIDQNKSLAQLKINEAEGRIIEANAQMETAKALTTRLEHEIEVVKNANERNASNVKALLEFDRGANVKMILKMKDSDWDLKIIKSSQLISKISSNSDLSTEIMNVLSDEGYDQNDSLFVDFVLDGGEPGTASAYRKIISAINSVKSQYTYLYFSETDISEVED